MEWPRLDYCGVLEDSYEVFMRPLWYSNRDWWPRLDYCGLLELEDSYEVSETQGELFC